MATSSCRLERSAGARDFGEVRLRRDELVRGAQGAASDEGLDLRDAIFHHLEAKAQHHRRVVLLRHADETDLAGLRIGDVDLVAAHRRRRAPKPFAELQGDAVFGELDALGRGQSRRITFCERCEILIDEADEAGAVAGLSRAGGRRGPAGQDAQKRAEKTQSQRLCRHAPSALTALAENGRATTGSRVRPERACPIRRARFAVARAWPRETRGRAWRCRYRRPARRTR